MTLDELFRSAAQGCGVEGCTEKHGEMFLTPRCHPHAGAQVSVDAAKGTMRVACAICNESIIVIKHTMLS